jgi:hypothetical protein
VLKLNAHVRAVFSKAFPHARVIFNFFSQPPAPRLPALENGVVNLWLRLRVWRAQGFGVVRNGLL